MHVAILAILGGLLSRWHGGGFFKAPRWLKNAAWATPPSLLMLLAYVDAQKPVAGLLWLLPCFLLCLACKASGHGGAMDLGRWTKPRKPEALEFLVAPLHGRIREDIYDGILLAVIGLAAVSGFVLAMAFINPLAAFCAAVGGLAKFHAYVIGWAAFPANVHGRATVTGEVLTGAFAYAGIAAGLVIGGV